jgi:hypothetical protein
MHAAMDRAGVGARCGLVARFEHRTTAEVSSAIAIARKRFPVLQMGLSWQGDRAMLNTLACASERGVWTHQLTSDGDGVWLKAEWTHAVADGHSMLRFLKAVVAVLEGGTAPVFAPLARAPSRPRRVMAPWLPSFLALQARRYVRVGSSETGREGTSWLVTSPNNADLICSSKNAGGFIGPLAAAAAMSVGAMANARRGGLVLLNIPILRDDLEAAGGFGFGVGSLLFPVRVGPATDVSRLSHRIGRRCQRLARQGWDLDLDRFLGDDPRRHHRFAAIRARRPADPAITVSWKGRHDGLGERVRHVACFAGSPALHVSAHTDEQGLSLSLTSSQSPGERTRLLADIAARLGIADGPVFQLSSVMAAPHSETARPVELTA